MAKHPTPQGISALLRDAGFASAESRLLGAIGRRKANAGYLVARHGRSGVVVAFQVGPEVSGLNAVSARFEEMLSAYAKVIGASGWRVRRDVPGYTASLIVSANEEE